MAYVAESNPIATIKDILELNWVPYLECPKPTILEANEIEEPYARFDLNMGDHIIIRTGGPEQIKYRGNIEYYDRAYPIALDIWTKEGRLRMRDIWKQIKAICFAKKFSFTGYQLIQLMSYTEMVNEQLNIWRAEANLQVTAAGVAIDTIT